MVEHFTDNEKVEGSIPSARTKTNRALFRLVIRIIRRKSALFVFVRSEGEGSGLSGAVLTFCDTICYSCSMRTTLNISMPPEQKKNVDRMIKDYHYASVSEFFRDAVRALEEDILVKDIAESEKEFSVGKGKKLRSLKDLG